MTIKDRIKKLCKENNISMNKLEIELGFGKGYISKLNNSTPNSSKLQKIADYFNVSLDYLMNGNQSKSDNIYIDQELFEYLQMSAEKNHRSIEKEIEYILSQATGFDFDDESDSYVELNFIVTDQPLD